MESSSDYGGLAGNSSMMKMVSIHVRLTDFEYHLKVLYNMTVVSNEFLTKAMTYFVNKYGVSIHAAFITENSTTYPFKIRNILYWPKFTNTRT